WRTLPRRSRAEAPLERHTSLSCLARVYAVTRIVVTDLDPTEAVALAREAEGADDDVALRQFAGAATLAFLGRGDIDAAEEALGQVVAVLARHGLAFDGATGQQSFGYAAMILDYRGRLADVLALVAVRDSPHPVGRFLLLFALAEAAWAAGDVEAMQAANDWHDNEPPFIVRSLGHRIRGLRSRLDGNSADALASFRRSATVNAWSAALEAALSIHLVPLLLDADQVPDATAFLDKIDADVARVGRPLRPASALSFGRALVARHLGDLDAAAAAADEALDLAHRSGEVLRCIEAVELVADIAHQRGTGRHAPRLLAWAAAERDRLGYRGRLVADGDTLDQRALILAELGDDTGDDRAAVPTDAAAAVELARRARGQRGRPSFGWDSLTTTERAVAAKVADGLTNAEIARELFMRPATVKSHLTRIFTKTGAANRTDLATRFARPTD
ncbi:MAG: LuxR C-terminal-related transcriptional regulator, partial [Acidimicrobiales bacterium]